MPVGINETPVAEGSVGYRAGGRYADVTANFVPRYRQLTRNRLYSVVIIHRSLIHSHIAHRNIAYTI